MMKKIFIIILIIATGYQAFAQHRKIKIITPYGKMILELSDETPAYRDNFIKLVKKHFYDGLLFHRVIKSFMIQGGDPNSRNAKPGELLGNGDVGYTIPAAFKADLFHQKGALAAAREGDDVNPAKASSGCQFYIVQGKKYTSEQLDQIEAGTGHHFTAEQKKIYETIGGTPFLDGSYTVFGQLIKGMDVLDKIASVPTDENDRPKRDVPMKIRMVHKFLFF
ncbi:MAG: peptidylprolyl isomerase [Chitinophagaceae bacterium]|jgi:peptidyl-prolyl cis-trans isomerase B (cyclophilin B)|nr:MAG: peptidylprolyl isomerase [Chitinophagaceae bacterium]